MWEFKFYSRGGQGAVTAAKILINAAIIVFECPGSRP